MIFGTSISKATDHQMAVQFPTSPNICFYTTWGKQYKRNMHCNEQQTSTNWRLDRIKNLITVVWANEVHRLLTYYSTSCYQTCRWWYVRVLAGQCTSASARKTIELLERKTPDFISLDLCPPTALTSIWSITSSRGSCNSGSIRRRSRMWMNSRSDWLKSGLECEWKCEWKKCEWKIYIAPIVEVESEALACEWLEVISRSTRKLCYRKDDRAMRPIYAILP